MKEQWRERGWALQAANANAKAPVSSFSSSTCVPVIKQHHHRCFVLLGDVIECHVFAHSKQPVFLAIRPPGCITIL